MLIFASPEGHPPPSHPPHPALALALPSLLALLLVGEGISQAIAARRSRYHSSTPLQPGDESLHPLLPQQQSPEQTSEHDARTEGKRTVLELLKVLLSAGLLSVCLMKVVGRPIGAWEGVMDGGVAGIAIFIALVSFASLVWTEWARVVRRQQIVLFGALVLVLGLKDLIPFIYVQHPHLSLSTTLGFAQLSLSFLLLLTLLLTPPHFTPLTSITPPNPAQLASPLSQLLFSWNETRMWGWYRRSGKAADHEFLEFVPPLPDYLGAGWVLGLFRWKGDEVREGEENEEGCKGGKEEITSGAVREFVWAFRWELIKILGFAVVWIIAIFVSPLSMNLLLSYVQDHTATRVSPYLYVLGIFLAPIVSSVAYQNAVYRLGQIGLRLRALLGHAVYKKLLKVKAGGGGTKDDDGEDGGEAKKGGAGGGAEAVGRVNNLVGTDIDVITSSLTISLQLFGVPPKLIVSLIFLYFLLGWSAFVALAAILAFAPISTIVSKKYGGAQEQIMQATDKRITIVGELVAAIRIIKMFSWEKSSMDKIYQARQAELDRIVQRAKVYAGMMFLSTGVPVVVTLTTFAAYVFGMKRPLTASTAFTSMALFGLLREAVISSTYLLSSFMRARVSLGRITRFIADTEELDSAPRKFEGDKIKIKEGKFRFSRYGSEGFTLDIDKLEIPTGKMTIIAGDVGSGKSALLSALLGEMHKSSGKVKYPAKVSTSFAAQSPWLQDNTVKANVLFGEDYDEERYHKTLHACALESDLDGFPDGDQTRVGEKGLSMSGGQKQRIALARAVYAYSDIVLLDDVLSAVDSNTAAHIVEHCLNSLLQGRTVVLVTHFVKMCTRGIDACELVVRLKDGKIEKQGPPETHLSPNGSRMLRTSSSHSSFMSRKSSSPKKEAEPAEHHHEESPGGASISLKVYQRYFSAMGGWAFWLGYAAVNLTAHVLMLSQGWWVGRWVNASDRDARPSFYFAIYACIQLASSISLTAMYLSLIFGAVKASRKLHQRLTKAIFGAPFRFFDVTPHGALLNRFSKDSEILDTEQVENLQPVLDYSVQVLFVAIIISVILPIFLLPAALISAVFFFIGRLYIRNALAARKQVAEARSPLFSTLGDTTSGVVTIRAFKREKHFATTYLAQTDRYNQMQLYEDGLDRWLEERSDIVGATVSFIVGLLALRAGIDSGTTGFLVSTGLEFTNRILYVVRAINKNELSLNSVQRILAYTDIEQEEADSEKGKPSASWPQGKIEFDDYSAKYSEDGPDVLHNLSFSVEQSAKIGIVGPSGCGKSSLSLALLRFIIPSNGTISIDGRTVDSTNLDALRSRITLIPQDPTLFSGTLRSNLDPNDEYDDAVLWQAVQRSGFAKQGEQGSEGAKGVSLDTVVQSGGSNFSQGQRQLLSLARALVRSSKIISCLRLSVKGSSSLPFSLFHIILDEATASLDNESDALMQKVIKEEFDDCTNITIAHRLESVIGFDKVLVLEAGRILEFDTPRKLLESTESRFYELCEATGNLDELKEKVK